MLGWLERTIGGWRDRVGDAVGGLVHDAVGGIAALISLVFGNVTRAWDAFLATAHDLELGAWMFADSVSRKLEELLHHYIPKFAFTAWWWCTHPAEFASVLFWHIVAQLERRAWTAARYLGDFTLALLTRNMRRVAQLAETVLAAVL